MESIIFSTSTQLHTYGFEMESLNLIYNYLFNKKQKVKAGTYSSWQELLFWGSTGISSRAMAIQYSQLFNILLCDLFYFLEGTIIAS